MEGFIGTIAAPQIYRLTWAFVISECYHHEDLAGACVYASFYVDMSGAFTRILENTRRKRRSMFEK
jgi:hypothetical protein